MKFETQKLEEEVHDRYILNKNFCISTGRGICSYGFDVTTGRIEIVDLDLNLLAYERVKDKNEVYGEDSMSLLRHEICELRELWTKNFNTKYTVRYFKEEYIGNLH